MHSFERLIHLLNDNAVDGRGDRERSAQGAGVFDLPNLLIRDVPIGEALSGGGQERPCPSGNVRVSRRPQAFRVLGRLQILLLGRDELGTVDVKEPLAALDRLADIVDGDVLNPSFVFRVHPRHRIVVVGQGTNGANGERDVRARHRLGPDTDVLNERRINPDGAGRRTVDGVGIDRHEIHTHRILGGLGRRDGRVHGRAPVQNLPRP